MSKIVLIELLASETNVQPSVGSGYMLWNQISDPVVDEGVFNESTGALSLNYSIGSAWKTMYFWLRVQDEHGNFSIQNLGSHRTDDLTDPTATFTLDHGTPSTSTALITGVSFSDNGSLAPTAYAVFDQNSAAPTAAAIKSGFTYSWDTSLQSQTDIQITGLTQGQTYYLHMLVEDAKGNDTISTQQVQMDIDTLGPLVDGASLTATGGLEETHVTISATVTDIVDTV